MEREIREATYAALQEYVAQKGGDIFAVNFAVEWPGDMAHGDYAVNVAMAAAKTLGTNPRELASELAPLIATQLGVLVSSVEVAGPGFINITLSPGAIALRIAQVINQGEAWGTNESKNSKRIMIEYGNPNPFKEMHIGHMTGAIIGESISRLIAASGATVLRDTFGGDVGPHVAKALWALHQKGVTDVASPKEIGAAYIHGSNSYEESTEAKAEIDELNTRIYQIVEAQNAPASLSEDDRSLLTLWRKGREVSMEEFNRLFALLGTKFDYTFFDSDTTTLGLAEVQRGLVNGVFEESEGAIIYRGEKAGLFTLVFITSRGNPTYETKDVGLALLKESHTTTDEVLITTAIEQIGHFKVVLAALHELLPALAEKTRHIPHGLLQLTTGKMSSRKGNIITAAELIREMIETALEKNPDPVIAEQVAIGAIKYMILRSAPGSNIIFDPEKSLSLDGDSGPYLQYALTRAKSVIAQADTDPETEANHEAPEKPYLIERVLVRFPEVVAAAQKNLAPHTIAQYVTQLAGEWNSFYAQERIRGGTHQAYKLQLAKAFVQTMENGLELLGIPIPEKM
jgi:arginyl-tRNA synthetase